MVVWHTETDNCHGKCVWKSIKVNELWNVWLFSVFILHRQRILNCLLWMKKTICVDSHYDLDKCVSSVFGLLLAVIQSGYWLKFYVVRLMLLNCRMYCVQHRTAQSMFVSAMWCEWNYVVVTTENSALMNGKWERKWAKLRRKFVSTKRLWKQTLYLTRTLQHRFVFNALISCVNT